MPERKTLKNDPLLQAIRGGIMAIGKLDPDFLGQPALDFPFSPSRADILAVNCVRGGVDIPDNVADFLCIEADSKEIVRNAKDAIRMWNESDGRAKAMTKSFVDFSLRALVVTQRAVGAEEMEIKANLIGLAQSMYPPVTR